METSRRRIGTLISAMIAALIVILAVLAVGVAWGLGALNRGLNDEMYREQGLIDDAYRLRVAAEREAVGARGFLLAGDPVSLANRQAGRAAFARALEALRRAELAPADRARLDAAERIHGEWSAMQERFAAARRQGRLAQVLPDLRDVAMPLRERAIGEIDAFILARTERVDDLHRRVGQRGTAIAWLATACGVLAVPLLAGLGWLASALDAMSRRVEEALALNRENERRFQLLVASVSDYGIFLIDPTGRVASWNKGAEALKGYRAEEIVGSPFARFFTPEDVAAGKPEQLLRLALEHGHVEDEGWRVRKDGSRFWANAVLTPVRDERGELRGFAKITRDLTERKRAEEALASQAAEVARQRKMLASIVEHVPAAIAFVDPDLVYRWNNPAHADMAGLPPERVVGRTVMEVFPEVAPMTGEVHHAVLASHQPVFKHGLVIPNRGEGGPRQRVYDVAYVPVAADGMVEGILVVASEVSERVAREQAQQQLIESLRAVDRMKDEFLSVLSHELRTPINAIMGFGSILEDEIPGPLNEEQRGFVGKILRGSDVLLALVDDLLDMGRIRAGKLTLDLREVDVREVVTHVVAAMAVLAEQKGQAIACELPPDLPPAWADEQRLGQVLTNLLGNAIKFTPDGGAIAVRAMVAGDQLRCEVRDAGVGIAAADLPRLFKQFSQLDSSATRKAGGTGLGLSISKALVEAHGGAIGAESAGPGTGATFWFTLPLARAG